MEYRPLEEMIALLNDEASVWVRLAGYRSPDGWALGLLEITAGAEPAGFAARSWQYERATFAADMFQGSTVAKWLANRLIAHGDHELAIAELGPSVSVERRESGFGGAFSPLAWPSEVWSIGISHQPAHLLQGELVSDEAPAFLEFDQAAAAFFGLPASMNRSYSGREIVMRVQDLRARITSVRLRPTEVIVTVEGSGLTGATLAIGGDHPGPVQRLSEDSEVTLPLPHGLPSRPWLALHRNYDLLDRRYLDASSREPGVEVEIDTQTRLSLLVAGGEGLRSEFKRELPRDNARGAMKTVSAFANGDGGTMVFGVDDEGAVLGITSASLRREADRIANLIRDYVHPSPLFEITAVDEEQVLIVDVKAGPSTPYGVGTNVKDLTFYVRRGASSFPASQDEIRAMVRAREPTPSSPHFAF